jgi:hypothetical protein
MSLAASVLHGQQTSLNQSWQAKRFIFELSAIFLTQSEVPAVFYIASHLLPKLVQKYGMSGDGPFKLFCGDFRSSNILMNPKTFKVTAVLNLEFTNAMPSQFASDPP